MDRRLALVTGASAGIGAAFCRIYASHGYDVALTARWAERLDDLAGELRARFGVEALTIPADLADPKAPEMILQRLAAQGRVVDVLVNNAGYGVPRGFLDSPWETHEAFLRVMLTAPTELAYRVLPGMAERRFGRIVNVASLAGLIPGSPGATLYGAVKSYLIKTSQSLHLETLGKGVHVSALCPGFTYSEFHDVNATREQISRSAPPWLWMDAEAVAAAGYAAVEANRPICVPGVPNKAIAAGVKLAPDAWALALMASQAPRFRGKV